jgi:hypothetical protein
MISFDFKATDEASITYEYTILIKEGLNIEYTLFEHGLFYQSGDNRLPIKEDYSFTTLSDMKSFLIQLISDIMEQFNELYPIKINRLPNSEERSNFDIPDEKFCFLEFEALKDFNAEQFASFVQNELALTLSDFELLTPQQMRFLIQRKLASNETKASFIKLENFLQIL